MHFFGPVAASPYDVESAIVVSDTTSIRLDRREGVIHELHKLLAAGRQHLLQQRYYEAERYFLKVLKLDKQNAAAHYFLAECQRYRFRYTEAMSWYQTTRNLDTTMALPQVAYYLALMQKSTGAYRTAHQGFDAFVNTHQASADSLLLEYVAYAKIEMKGIELADQLSLQPSPERSFQRFPWPVNSPSHDYAPQMWPHDTSLIISSTRLQARGNAYDERYGEDLSDLFVWKKEEKQWMKPATAHPLTALNTRTSEGSGVFNQAGDKFYFSECSSQRHCRLLMSHWQGDEWSKPLPLNEQVNMPGYSTKHPALSTGGDTLFFASDRPGGYGQFDIWMSTATNGIWQSPINLGEPVNTARNEVSPAFHVGERVLLFASNGQTGVGGYDLYLTYEQLSTSNRSVVNLGYPFNSPKDDLYLCLRERQALLTSNRDNEDGNFDIYSFQLQSQDISALIKREPEPIADEYAVLFSPASLFIPEDRAFYEQLPRAEKVRAKRYIQRQAFREVIAEQVAQTDTTEHQYNQLSEQEKGVVQRLARAKKEFVLRETTEAMLTEDRIYYEQLSPSEKNKVIALVDERWLKELLQENVALDDDGMHFFEKLPAEDQQRIVRAIQQQRMILRQAWEEPPTLEDMFYYQALPPDEKATLEQILVARRFLEVAWEAQVDDSMRYVYERLAPDEQEMVSQYIRRQSFRRALTEGTVLSEEAQQHYEALNTSEKEAVNRLARVKKQFLMKEVVDSTSVEDQRFYRRLPEHEKGLITQVIDARIFALLVQDTVSVSDEESQMLERLPLKDQQQVARAIASRQEFHQRTFQHLPTVNEVLDYQMLSAEEKNSVRRSAKTRQFSTRELSGVGQNPEITQWYEQLPRADQESVDRIVAARQHFLLKGEQTELLAEDQYYLETLFPEEKQRVNRIIEVRTLEELAIESQSTAQLIFYYQTLHRPEKQRIDRFSQTRRFFQQIPEEDASTLPDTYVLQTVASVLEKATITGKLSSRSGEDLPGHVFLLNNQQDTVGYAAVATDGTFTFEKVAYQENYHVAYDPPAQLFSRKTDYIVEELVIEPVTETNSLVTGIQLKNIYFATNQHTLPSTARNTLDSLVQYHRQHPATAIDIRAFADSTGTSAYNLKLTQRRAHSVRQYLEAHGVAPHCLSQWAMGSARGNYLPQCRRVELSVGQPPALPSFPKTIYNIRAHPDLLYLADRYQISLTKLKEWNRSENLAPYTPIRIVIESE